MWSRTSNNLESHDKVLEISRYLDLIDVWRKMNTEERRFTWHGPNRKQSRLDYCLISSDLESFIKRSEIGLSYRPSPGVCLIPIS